MGSPSTLAAALDLAEAGYRVFPLWSVREDGSCHCDVRGCPSPGKHPHGRLALHGVKGATDDARTIEAWWRQYPQANIGLATGPGSFALDADGSRGVAALLELAETGGWRADLEAAPRARTGGEGYHYFLASDLEIRNQQRLQLPDGSRLEGVDVRGEGGYVVVPPSLHASGRRYTWQIHLLERRPRAAPPALLQILAGEALAPAPNPAPVPAPKPAPARAPRIPERVVPDHEVDTIRSALAIISPACDRQTWIERVAMPLHDHFGGSETGFAVFHEWSAGAKGRLTPSGNPAYRNEEDCRRQWRSFSAVHRDPKGIASLYQEAITRGWRVPAAQPSLNGQAAPPAPIPIWDKPESLEGGGPAPSLDLEAAFPPALGWLRDLCSRIADLVQVPVEFPATLALGMATGTYGGLYELRLAGTGWVEHPPLWVLCAFHSGAGKSPVFRELARPFHAFDAIADDDGDMDEWEARVAVARVQLAKAHGDLRRQAAKMEDSPPLRQRLEAAALHAQRNLGAAERSRPQSNRVLAGSLTTPALVEFLQWHRGRCLIVDPEGGVFQHALGGRRDIDVDLDPWLKGFSCEQIRQRRIGDSKRGGPVDRFVPRPYLSMALCTQVAALSFLSDPFAAGKGFAARFLPLVFRRQLPARAIVPGQIPTELAKRWDHVVHGILSRPVPERPSTIELAGEGYQAFEAWAQRWLDDARADPDTDEIDPAGYISDSGPKVRSNVLRIMLALHVLTSGDDVPLEVSSDAWRATIDGWAPFVRMATSHAMGQVRDDPDIQIARRILRWLGRKGSRKHADPWILSRSEIFRAVKGSTVRRVDDINRPLAMLVDTGWIRPAGRVEHRGGGAPPAAARYEIHPTLPRHLGRA